jgi:hypothetical protein
MGQTAISAAGFVNSRKKYTCRHLTPLQFQNSWRDHALLRGLRDKRSCLSKDLRQLYQLL